MARRFTLAEAEELLPEIEQTMRRAIELRAEYAQAESGLQDASRRIMMLGGSRVDPEAFLGLRARRDTSGAALKEVIEHIHEFGCLVKDLDVGLVDFPTLFRGQEVYLCWKLGESGIRFWHGVQEGFRGRKPIDRDFLDEHCGDKPN